MVSCMQHICACVTSECFRLGELLSYLLLKVSVGRCFKIWKWAGVCCLPPASFISHILPILNIHVTLRQDIATYLATISYHLAYKGGIDQVGFCVAADTLDTIAIVSYDLHCF